MASKRDMFKKATESLPTKDAIKKTPTSALQNIVHGDKLEHRHLKTAAIKLNPANDYRAEDTEEDIAELAKDLERNGMLHNIVVSYHADENEYVLLSGERRLKAVQYNAKQYPNDTKWQEVYAQIRLDLSPRRELIIMDAANLESRGSGAKAEARYRKAIDRFVKNVREEFSLSEKEAVAMAASFVGVTETTIQRNRSIEKDLIPGLKSLMDEGHLTKNACLSFLALSQPEQEHIAKVVAGLVEKADTAAVMTYSDKAVAAIKNDELVTAVKAEEKKSRPAALTEMEKVLKNISKAKRSLSALVASASLTRVILDSDMTSTDDKARVKAEMDDLLEQMKILMEKYQ